MKKDKLYIKTIVEYWGIRYDVDTHNWIPILTKAIAEIKMDITSYPIPK